MNAFIQLGTLSIHKKYFSMGLKPLLSLYLLNPFTKVNGNIRTHIQQCCGSIAVRVCTNLQASIFWPGKVCTNVQASIFWPGSVCTNVQASIFWPGRVCTNVQASNFRPARVCTNVHGMPFQFFRFVWMYTGALLLFGLVNIQ